MTSAIPRRDDWDLKLILACTAKLRLTIGQGLQTVLQRDSFQSPVEHPASQPKSNGCRLLSNVTASSQTKRQHPRSGRQCLRSARRRGALQAPVEVFVEGQCLQAARLRDEITLLAECPDARNEQMLMSAGC